MAEHIIETERLLIRRFSLGDAAEFLPLVVLPEVLRYTGEQALTSTSEVIDLLTERQLRDYRVHGYGRMACLEKASGRLIGFSGLKYLDDLDKTDLGYRFLPETWGKGYATESASAIMDVQPSALGLTRVIALVEPNNEGSIRVLRKLGMSYEGRVVVKDHGELDRYVIGLDATGTAIQKKPLAAKLVAEVRVHQAP